MRTTVKVAAPAVLSGLTGIPGLFYAALDIPGAEVTVYRTEADGVRISSVTGDKPGREIAAETVSNALKIYLDTRDNIGIKGLRIDIRLCKHYFTALGGVAPALAAALVAVDFLSADRLPLKALIPFAENAIKNHAAAAFVAALSGGVVMDSGMKEERYKKVFMPAGLHFLLIKPPLSHSFDQRGAISYLNPLDTAQKAAALAIGGTTGDWQLLRHALETPTELFSGEWKAILEEIRTLEPIGMGWSECGEMLFVVCENSGIAEDIAVVLRRYFAPGRHQMSPLIRPLHLSGHRIF